LDIRFGAAAQPEGEQLAADRSSADASARIAELDGGDVGRREDRDRERSVVTGSIGLACPLREGLVGIRVLMMLG
jgi:hypothetical protein